MAYAQFKSSEGENEKDRIEKMNTSLAGLYKEKIALQRRLKEVEALESDIFDRRKKIVRLHLKKNGEDLLADEREIVVSDLIEACNKQSIMKFEGGESGYSTASISPRVKKALKRCHEYDIIPEFVSDVLFIFSLTGSEIDLDNINMKDLDPADAKDRDMIERIAVYLNEETDLAIRTCMDMISEEDRSRLFYNKIEKIKKALIDFKEPKRKYDEYMLKQKEKRKRYMKNLPFEDKVRKAA